jgi:hypothetical protein
VEEGAHGFLTIRAEICHTHHYRWYDMLLERFR